MTEERPTNWILTGSLENFRINVERGFDVIGFKEGRRRQAELRERLASQIAATRA